MSFSLPMLKVLSILSSENFLYLLRYRYLSSLLLITSFF